MRTHFFTVVLPVRNHLPGLEIVATGDEFSIIYIFIAIFVNRVYSKFDVSNFDFHCKKQLRIQRSVFCFSNAKKQNKVSQINISKFILWNETKLTINS